MIGSGTLPSSGAGIAGETHWLLAQPRCRGAECRGAARRHSDWLLLRTPSGLRHTPQVVCTTAVSCSFSDKPPAGFGDIPCPVQGPENGGRLPARDIRKNPAATEKRSRCLLNRVCFQRKSCVARQGLYATACTTFNLASMTDNRRPGTRAPSVRCIRRNPGSPCTTKRWRSRRLTFAVLAPLRRWVTWLRPPGDAYQLKLENSGLLGLQSKRAAWPSFFARCRGIVDDRLDANKFYLVSSSPDAGDVARPAG